ncbi:hypothetical protein M0804_015125 [Polistes exclamans]|nr:hypothetical protein M0804_015126 [Polistes exclamans]KAI4473879.1 hypothetical protein M0804_015125 [Polistes exclamans]
MDQSSIAGPAESARLLPAKARGEGPLRCHTRFGYLLCRFKVGTSTQQGRTTLGSGRRRKRRRRRRRRRR